ncbi:flagellar motor switch protein FliN [Mesobacillus maritimus]|uniref:flagellar motor switch protein FliN n=1 Tax=Mesobacillus maritimus TaxID=1643336 RepID=UPI00384DE4CC
MTIKGLSPDEISGLLGPQKREGENVSVPTLSSYETEVLAEIFSVSFGSASGVLTSLFDEQVSISGPELSVKQKAEIRYPSFIGVGNYSGEVNGRQFLFIHKETVVNIARKMNVPLAEEENQSLFQVVQEVFGKVFAAISDSMSSILELDLAHTLSRVDLIEGSEDELSVGKFSEAEAFVHASFSILTSSQENLGFTICLPVETAEEIVEVVTGSMNETNKEVELPTMSQNQTPNLNIQSVQFSSFDESPSQQTEPNNIDLLLDIPLQVTVELGRTKKMVKEILEVSPGSIIELDKLSGEPVDILINNKLIAVGEVVVIDDNFGVRVTDILSPMDRISKLR